MDKVIAASLTLDASQANKSVKEFKNDLKQAENDYKILRDTVGETNAATIAAAENINKIKQQINQAAESMKSFKTRVREAEQNLITIQQTFGATSKEALEAAKGVAQMKDQMKEAREVSDLFDPGAKFQVFGNVLRTVAGGFSALTGTMALFGAESEEVEKSILKVQAALAITEGVNTIVDSAKDFDRLKAVIMQSTVVQKVYATSTAIASTVTKALGVSATTTSVGFKVLRGAILATGIGALVVALGLLITNFDKVKQVVMNLIPGLSGVADTIGNIINKVTDFVGATSQAERTLDRFSKATKRNNEDLEDRIKILSAQGGKEKEVSEIRQTIMNNELRLLNYKKNVEGKLAEEDKKRVRDLVTEKQVIALQEQERLKQVAENAKKEAERNSEEARRKREEAKKNREERLKELNQELEDAKKFRAEMQALEEDVTVRINALDAEEVQKKKDLFNERIANTRKAIEDEANVVSELKYLQMDQIAQQGSDELYKLGLWYEERRKLVQAGSQAEIDLTKQAAHMKANIERSVLNQRLQIVSGFLGNAADLLGKHTAAGKVLAIGEATISTYLSAQKAYNSMIGIPVVGPVLAPVAAGVAIAAGLKNIREITRVKLPGASSSAPSLPSISAQAPLSPQKFSPQVMTTKLPQDQINQIGQFSTRAYVLEADVSNSQERNKMLNRQARLGG